MDDVIKDLLRFSKNNYQRLESEKIAIEPLIWKIIGGNNKIQHFQRIHFELSIDQKELFYSDPERLEIILNNIIRNAIVFSDATKSRPFVTVKVSIAHGESIFEVQDNGIGIGNTHLPDIFNMFYRATDRAKGAGLGLYVAKEAVERLKGNIQAESEIGFGSRFRIQIPNDNKGLLISRKQRLQEGKL